MFAMVELAFVPVLLMRLAVSLVLAAFAFWIWTLVHVAQNKGLNEAEKVAWVHFLGSLISLFVRRPRANLPPISA